MSGDDSHMPIGRLNPERDKECFFPRKGDPATRPIECMLYRWFAGHVAQMQADFVKQPTNEIRERAVHYWRLVLNCLGPIAAEARGKEYADHYYVLADQMRDLATRGDTPAGIIHIIEKQLRAGQPHAKQLPSTLTARRRSVLVLVGRGLTDGEIAETLNIARATCGMHLRHLLAYFRARNRTQMIRRAMESGELPKEDDDAVVLVSKPEPKAKPKPALPPPPKPSEMMTVPRRRGRPINPDAELAPMPMV